jgi:hypothetical protein
MEKSRYRTRQRKYNRKRKPVSAGIGFFNDLIQKDLHIDNETYADENVNDMWWGDTKDSSDDDDSDYDPDEDSENSDDSNDADFHTNDARAMNNDDDIEELLFIEDSIYPSGFNFSELLKEILQRETVGRNNEEEERLHENVNVSNSTVSEFAVDMKFEFKVRYVLLRLLFISDELLQYEYI